MAVLRIMRSEKMGKRKVVERNGYRYIYDGDTLVNTYKINQRTRSDNAQKPTTQMTQAEKDARAGSKETSVIYNKPKVQSNEEAQKRVEARKNYSGNDNAMNQREREARKSSKEFDTYLKDEALKKTRTYEQDMRDSSRELESFRKKRREYELAYNKRIGKSDKVASLLSDVYKRERGKEFGADTYQADFTNLFNEYQAISSKFGKEYVSPDEIGSLSKKVDDFVKRANLANDYATIYGEDMPPTLYSMYNAIGKDIDKIKQYTDFAKNDYAKYDSAEHYNISKINNYGDLVNLRKQYEQMAISGNPEERIKAEKLLKSIDEKVSTAQIAMTMTPDDIESEKKRFSESVYNTMQPGRNVSYTPEGYMYYDYGKAEKEIDKENSAEAILDKFDDAVKESEALRLIKDYTNREDFESSRSAVSPKYTQDNGTSLPNTSENEAKLIYNAVNGDSESIEMQRGTEAILDGRRTNIDFSVISTMTGDEIDTYNYIVNTQGLEAGSEFVKKLSGVLNKRKSDELSAEAYKYAQEHPFLSLISGVLSAPISAIGDLTTTVSDIYNGATGKGIDIYDERHRGQNISSAMSQGGQSAFESPIAQFLYGTAESGGKEAMLYATTLGIGKAFNLGGKALSAINMAAHSGSAFEGKLIQYKEEGYSDASALIAGLVSAGIEAATEALPMDRLLKTPDVLSGMNTKKIVQIMKRAGVSGIEEGLEEGASMILGDIYDIATNHEKLTAYYQAYNKAIKEGKSEKEATVQGFLSAIGELGQNVLAGAFVGMGMSASNSASVVIRSDKVRSIAENYFRDNGSEDMNVATLLTQFGMPADTETLNTAKNLIGLVNGKLITPELRDSVNNTPELRGVVQALANIKAEGGFDTEETVDNTEPVETSAPTDIKDKPSDLFTTLTSGKLSSNQIDGIIDNPDQKQEFQELTGITIEGSKAKQRNIMQEWIRDKLNIEEIKLKKAGFESLPLLYEHSKVNDLLENPNSKNVGEILYNAKLARAFEELIGQEFPKTFDGRREFIRENAELARKVYAESQKTGRGTIRQSLYRDLDEIGGETIPTTENVSKNPKRTFFNKSDAEAVKSGIENINADKQFANMGRSASKVYSNYVSKDSGLVKKFVRAGMRVGTAQSTADSIFHFMYDAGKRGTKLEVAVSAMERIHPGIKEYTTAFYYAGANDSNLMVGKKGAKITENDVIKRMRESKKIDGYIEKAINTIAKKIGFNITFVSKKELGEGNNGSFNLKTGEIKINEDSEIPYVVAVIHESIHAIRSIAPKNYNELADLVFELITKDSEMFGESWKHIRDLYREQITDKDGNVNKDLINEEYVANVVSTLLFDKQFVNDLAKEDMGFVQKIFKAIKDLFDKILGRYNTRAKTDAELNGAVKLLKSEFDKIKGIYESALSATESVQTDSVTVNDLTAPSDVVLYNLAAVKSHKESLEKNYNENQAEVDYQTLVDRYNEVLGIWEELGGELDSKFLNEWNEKKGSDRAFTLFKKQMGYKYNIELSTMCKKGVALFDAIDTIVKKEVAKRLNTDTIGKAEKEILYDILKTRGFEIPCAICYVEQARQQEGITINAFCDGNDSGKLGWNSVLDEIEKKMKKSGVDYKFPSLDRSVATDRYVPKSINMSEREQNAFYKALVELANKEIERSNQTAKKPRSKITSIDPKAIKSVLKGALNENLAIFQNLFNNPNARFRIDNDLLYSSETTMNLSYFHSDLYTLFNRQRGQAGYKTKQKPMVYWGDVLNKKLAPATVRKEGGIRSQSNSDTQMYTFLDEVQRFIDYSAKGYYGHEYTKVLAKAKLFGLSNIKENISLIPKVKLMYTGGKFDEQKTKENAGLDENGNLLFDGVEGANADETFMLTSDKEYSKSLTATCIGYSDNHILKMLDDPRIQLIIGFHDTTNDTSKRYVGAKYSKNYNEENEATYKSTGKTKHIAFNDFVMKAEKSFKYNKNTETFEGITTFNGKEYIANDIPKLAVAMYLEYCEENNLNPAYSTGETDFSTHENYYKLLGDFGMYDSEGNYAPHRKVTFELPEQVPYLDENGNKKYMPTKDYIKKEIEKELDVMDSISEALADESENGIMAEFVRRVNKQNSESESEDLMYSKSPTQSATDAEYLELAKNPEKNEARLRGMVDEAAKSAGYIPVTRYHQTGRKFNIFSNEKPDAGLNDSDTPNGYFFKENDHDIGVGADFVKTGHGGSIQMATYLKTNNMLYFENREDARKWYSENIVGYRELLEKYDAHLSEFEKINKETQDKMFDELIELEKSGKSTPALDTQIIEKYDKIVDDWIDDSKSYSDGLRAGMRDLLNKYFIEGNSGYDGIELADDGHRYIDMKREDVHTFIVFENTQIKSADLVTYDDNGNIIPLSQRFNESNEDIRYSKSTKRTSKLKDITPEYVRGEVTRDFESFKKLVIETMDEEIAKAKTKAKPKVKATPDTADIIENSTYVGDDGQKVVIVPEGTPGAKKVYISSDYQAVEKPSDRVRTGELGKSRVAFTTLRSNVLNNEQAKSIMERLANDESFGTYVKFTDEEALNEAKRKFESDGYDQMLADWKSVVDAGYFPDKQWTVDGQWLLKQASKNGDMDAVIYIMSELMSSATQSAQNVQSYSILAKGLSGEAQAYMQMKSLKKLERQIRMKKGNEGVTLEFDKALMNEYIEAVNRELGVTESEAVETETLSAKSDKVRRSSEILQEMWAKVAEQVPPTWADTFRTWRYASMLMSPSTHISNILSNFGHYIQTLNKNIIASFGEKMTVEKGKRTKSLSSSLKGLLPGGIRKTFKSESNYRYAIKDANTMQSELQEDNKYSNAKKTSRSKWKWLDTFAEKAVFGLLKKEDWLFMKGHYARALTNYMDANGYTPSSITEEQLDKGRKIAMDEARRATFNEANKFADWLNKQSQKHPVFEFIIGSEFPFAKVPANVLKTGIEYSPLGFIRTLNPLHVKGLKGDIYKLRKGEINGAEYIDRISRNLTGTMVYALGAYLMSLGIISIGDDDDEEVEGTLYGKQKYSINAFGYSWTLDWFSPAGIALFAGADFWKKITEDNEAFEFSDLLDIFPATFNSTVNTLFSMTMLENIAYAVNSFQYGDNWSDKAGDFAVSLYFGRISQFVPSLVGNISKSIDNTKRGVYVDKNSKVPEQVQVGYQQMVRKLPFLLPETVNEHGEPEKNSVDNVVMRTIDNIALPGSLKKLRSSAVDDELMRLYKEVPNGKDALPKKLAKHIGEGEERKDLTAKEYARMQTVFGQTYYGKLKEIIGTDYYNNLSDENKVKLLKKVKEYATEKAKSETDSRFHPDSWLKIAMETPGVYQYVIDTNPKDSFGVDDLTDAQDENFRIDRSDIVNNILAQYKPDDTDYDFADKFYDYLHSYSKEVALEKNSDGQYVVDTKWMIAAKSMNSRKQAEFIYAKALISGMKDSEANEVLKNDSFISADVKAHLQDFGTHFSQTPNSLYESGGKGEENLSKYNISMDVFVDAINTKENLEKYKDANGKTVSVQKQMCEYIGKLNISDAQKSALYRVWYQDRNAKGKSTIKEVTWNYVWK